MRRQPQQNVQWILALLVLSAALCGTAAAAEPDYSITYTITVTPDGSALWRVEYRTLLSSGQDAADFEAYSRDIQAVSVPQFRDLMEKSAAQAAVATGRHMAVSKVTGTSAVQTSPTGQYGVVIYTLLWEGFVRPGPDLTVGDAFAGGLYLAKGNTLIIRYPDGYAVQAVEPVPDSERDGLVWYGQRSFGAGEPRVVLEQAGLPLLPVAAGLLLVLITALAAFYFYRMRNTAAGREDALEFPPLAREEIMDLEERILRLIRAQGGEMYQSEIVRDLSLPKSTVSSALNDMHARGVVIKVKKGRENLIRLA